MIFPLNPLDQQKMVIWSLLNMVYVYGEVILNDHPDVPYVQYKSLLIIANSSMIIMASQQKHEFHAGWWFETWFLFSIIYGIIHQPLTFIFFNMVEMVGGSKSSPNGRWHGVDGTWSSHWIPWISKKWWFDRISSGETSSRPKPVLPNPGNHG